MRDRAHRLVRARRADRAGRRRSRPASVDLVRALAPADPAACAALIEGTADRSLAARFAAEAALAADDAGLAAGDAAPLTAHVARWEDVDDLDLRGLWLAYEVRRLARHDLDAALALEPRLPEEHAFDRDASLAVAARLATADGPRAVAAAAAHRPDVDHLPWLLGCARAEAPGAADLVDTWIDALGPGTYDPYAYFAGVLDACLELGDADRARRLLAAGGPTGWQVAHAARWPLPRAATRGAAAALLDALLDRYPPGIVAGRAGDRSGLILGAGRMVLRPEWLALTDPHPVETLSIVGALGADGPPWGGAALP